MILLNPTDSRPLYEQITEKMKTLIIDGYLCENDKIPSVRELASELAINPNTIQKAYKLLETEGYIASRQSKGYFVCNNSDNKSKIKKLTDLFEKTANELKFLGVGDGELNKILENIYRKEN